jgi:hypothetical protein
MDLLTIELNSLTKHLELLTNLDSIKTDTNLLTAYLDPLTTDLYLQTALDSLITDLVFFNIIAFLYTFLSAIP